MALLASDIFTEAAALLNDTAKSIYSDAVMLPYLKKAYDALQAEFNLIGLQILEEVVAVIDVAASPVSSTVIALPADFLYPLALYERTEGETAPDSWELMEYKGSWGEDEEADDSLDYWVWRKNTVFLPPVTVAKEVRLRYYKSLPVIASGATDIPVLYSKGYLSSKTAEYAAIFIGQNTERYQYLHSESERELNKILRTAVKNLQLTMSAKRRDPFENVF